jgi:hypothetical protein
MALKVVTAKLSDGTTQTCSVPASTTPDAFVLHIKQSGGFWSDQNIQGKGGQSVGALWVPYHAIVNITWTS